MVDREKTALGIREMLMRDTWRDIDANRPRYQHILNDALALLKEQEARILDWDELEDLQNAVWFEDKDEHECYIALIANVGAYDAKFVNVEPGNIHSLVFMRDFYMKEWRCWSARPTIKQRQAVKWE